MLARSNERYNLLTKSFSSGDKYTLNQSADELIQFVYEQRRISLPIIYLLEKAYATCNLKVQIAVADALLFLLNSSFYNDEDVTLNQGRSVSEITLKLLDVVKEIFSYCNEPVIRSFFIFHSTPISDYLKNSLFSDYYKEVCEYIISQNQYYRKFYAFQRIYPQNQLADWLKIITDNIEK